MNMKGFLENVMRNQEQRGLCKLAIIRNEDLWKQLK